MRTRVRTSFVFTAILLVPASGAIGGISGIFARGDEYPTLPNLTPRSPSAAQPLRKINSHSATMIPMSYCPSALPADQEVEVDVPPFDWGVANDNRTEVKQAFSVMLLNGASPSAPLATETVQSIPQMGTRIFRNWPGRPTRVKVIRVTGANPKFASEYNSAPGCYIPTARAGSVTLDPNLLVVRVDAGGQIAERVETDNDLTR